MTKSLYIQCVAMFILGQAAHLFLIKVPAVKQRCRAANKPFTWKEWWNCDWNVVIGTQIVGALVIIGLDQLLNWKPFILDYVKWFFAGVGAFGSTVAMAKWSQYEKSLNALLDVKSNVADAITGGTTTVKETVEKGEAATGQEISSTKR
jgi:hypothetical protein